MLFQTRLVDSHDGLGTFGIVERQLKDGSWQYLDETKPYKEYPCMVRARAAAESLARKWAKKLYPDIIATFTRF
jgi:hypothetical protein